MIQGPAPRISESIVAKALPLPKVGSLVGGKKVTKVRVQDTDPNYYVVGISLEKGVKRKDVEASLMELLNVHIINSKEAGDLVVGKKHFEMVPTRNGPVVYIAMHIVPIIRSNPGKVLSPLEDFDMHYTKMEELNPKKWFRQFAFKNPHGPAYRDRLWKFVGYMGESYGYSDKGNIYHRRASTIMPKIKITKAVPNCDTFYHTHPSKDEPSLTSPDDYLLYFDLSYEPRSIRNFYTIMKDRIDHFKITPKKDSKGNYVRIGEDNFIDEVDAKIDELMEKYTDSFPMDKMGGLKFCEKVTRETVKWLNKKYGKYVTVKYNCYFRVRQNPPEPNYVDLHLGDTFISKAIADIQSGEYSWPKSDMDKKPQEAYAYWFGQYYFMEEDHSRQTALLAAVGSDDEVATMPRERSRKLGMLPGRLRAINHYLDQKVTRDYSYYDMMNLLNLHIDIMRIDSKITDGGGVKSRIEDMAEAMEIPQEVKDDLLVIEEARLLGPYTAEAKTLAGDYYVVLLLVDLCLRAVEIMEEVKAGTKDVNYARYEVYNKLKQQAIEKIDGELIKYQKDFNRGKKAVLLNPATTLKKSEYSAFIPPQYLAVGGIVTEALEQFAPYEAGKPFITGKSKLNMRVPGGGTLVSVQLSSLNTGNLQLFVPAKGHPIPEDPDKAALDAYQEIVNRLNEYGLNIPTEEQEVGSTTVSNPRQDSQVILIAGPSGSGKSTTIRNLLKSLPNSKTVPTFTTRPKRKSDKAGEKRFVTKEQFKAMDAAGEFAESALQKNGNHYGRRREDFMGADYVVVDASLSGVNRLARMFPNAYTVYLEPQESPEFIRQRLIRRGDMSPQEARGRSSLIPSHIRSSKMMSFDKRIITKQGHFNDIAVEILDSIPRNNPVIPFRIPPEAAPELDKRLTAMMQRQGYKPQTIKEAIAEGLYDDQPSDFSYAQGEYDEFLEEIAKGDMDEAFAEYSDVEGHVAYWLYTNHGIEVPIYNTIHLDKTRKRIEVFDNIFTEFGLEFDSKYLKGGSNFQKTTKVRLALETAAKDQGKPFTATDNEIRDAIAKAVPGVVMENPNPYYNAHLYASGSRDPFFPGDVPVAPPDLLRGNPPERRREPVTLEQFTRWVQLVNMKNKELKRFLDSPLGKKAGINKERQKEFGGINRGRTSGLAILRMRKKLGLSGPKDYIKNGPMIIKRYYDMALEKWNETDWYWCSRQISFNSRARGQRGPYTDKKGRPTRKLLALWVWGHDPWRYARKIENRVNMPACPNVPWIGMTEKRKWGTTEFTYNPGRIPKKYEGQDPSEHSDLFTDEDPVNTIQGLGFKDKETAEKSINIIKRSGKTHAHKMQAAMAMEQRARFHAHQTPGIRAGQKVYAKFIEEMKEKTKAMRNPRTPKGKKFPTKYLKGLTPLEKEIAIKEIDDGYEYDLDDPEAYKYWESDIKATARGYKTVPSKYQKKFVKMYGPLPEKGDFLDKVAKATKIKKSILQKVYDKGLAAWRVGHRPGVQQHQWAAGRVYSFVTLGNTVMKSGKKMPDYSLAVEAGLIKSNPGITYRQVEPEVFIPIRDNAKRLPFLSNYGVEELKASGSRAYLSSDNQTGYVLSIAGDLQNVFNSGPRGQGRTAVMDAIARGARTVDAFDPFLPRYYAQFGFQEYDRVKWNDEYAPADWPYETYGRPDVVFMRIGPLPNPHVGSKKYEKEWRHGKFAEDDPFADMFNV